MLGPYALGPDADTQGIVTGDALELAQAIPDDSVDLIFTDPVYWQIDDYRWLAETAERVLRPNSVVLVWIANPRIKAVIEAMSALQFVMPLIYVTPGGCNMMFSRKVFVWTKICLWFENGKSVITHAIPDTIMSTKAPANGYKWNKNHEAYRQWLEAFSQSGQIVFDPFTGSGTLPAVCKMLGRRWLAFEIDADTAERARRRVAQTQPPLFVTGDVDTQPVMPGLEPGRDGEREAQ